jgi:predicted DsbA family dithiol-disulfide isomerase
VRWQDYHCGKMEASVAASAAERLCASMAAEGIRVSAESMVCNTRPLHALSEQALVERGVSGQGALVERLFVAQFERGMNLGDPEVLLSVARESGLREDVSRELVAAAREESGKGAVKPRLLEAVDVAAARAACSSRMRGIPFARIDSGEVVYGAQEAAFLGHLFVTSLRNRGVRPRDLDPSASVTCPAGDGACAGGGGSVAGPEPTERADSTDSDDDAAPAAPLRRPEAPPAATAAAAAAAAAAQPHAAHPASANTHFLPSAARSAIIPPGTVCVPRRLAAGGMDHDGCACDDKEDG